MCSILSLKYSGESFKNSVKEKNMAKYFCVIFMIFSPFAVVAGNCDYSWQRDSAGRRCGGRAASVIPGGRLGGDGRYTDSYGRDRVWGRNNDPYDKPNSYYDSNNSLNSYGYGK